MPRSHRFITPARALTLCLAFALAWPALALADTARFEIKAEPLSAALKTFAQQAHMQLLYEYNTVRDLQGNPVIGVIEKHAALAELLRNTGLEAVFTSATAATIRPILVPMSGAIPRSSRAATKEAGNDKRKEGIRPIGTGNLDYGTDEPATNDRKDNSKAKPVALEEVIVTGSRLPTTAKEGPQEVQIFDATQIDQSGQNSIADFLTTLPAVSLAPPSNAFGVGPTVALRGLPVGTTLVLLNGRRLESSGLANWVSGAAYFDLNDIPLAAVKKIEVDESGASAIYGSDAIAGVVNIETKQNINGFEASARYGWAKGTSVARTDFVWGKQWEGAGLSVISSYDIDGGLSNADRRLSASNDYTSLGGVNNNLPVCSPGNVFSTTGAPLPGAPEGGATFAAVGASIPAGRPPLSGFAYGKLNTCSFLAGSSLLPATHRAGVLVQGHVQITPAVELFTELMYTHLSQQQWSGYQSLYGATTFQRYTVSASNPYNPFGTTVGVAESLQNVPTAQIYNTDFLRSLVGIKGTLLHNWQWELSMWQSTDWSSDTLLNLTPDSSEIQSALDSSNPATALNPFVNGPIASQLQLDSLFTDGNIKWMSRDRSAEAFIRGPVLRLPAGNVEAVLGGDYVRSVFDTDQIQYGPEPPNMRLSFARTYYALFGETRIPLIKGLAGSHSPSLLALTIAGRHDQYNDVGGSTTDQFGLELRPAEGLLIHGTYAEAFEAPTLSSLANPDTETTTVVLDPLSGNRGFVQLIGGGNPQLRPMTGISRTAGIDYSSPALSGLTLSATQWQVVENNAIQAVSPQVIVDNENMFPDRVIRNSTGAIEEVNDTDLNFGSINVAGIDYQLTYGHLVMGGHLVFGIDASETYHYRQALTPGVAAVESVSKAQNDQNWAPRWKGLVNIGYTYESITAHIDGRYTGSYQDYASTREIGNFWICDANVRWDLGQWLGGRSIWSRNAYIEAGATNLLNRAPQFSNYEFGYYGYDAAQMNIVGRSTYVETGLRW